MVQSMLGKNRSMRPGCAWQSCLARGQRNDLRLRCAMNQFGIVLRRNRRWVIGLMPLTAAIMVVALLGHGVVHVRDAAERSNEALGQICVGLHNYEGVHGALPPAAVTDKDGKPLLSWRVLILPFIEEEKRFRQFHL